MQGLRTQEFERFFKVVQDAANDLHGVFFLAAGDGRDLIKDDLEGEDLQGWLIPDEKVKMFESLFSGHQEDEEWDEFFCFAEWAEDNGKIEIKFNTY